MAIIRIGNSLGVTIPDKLSNFKVGRKELRKLSSLGLFVLMALILAAILSTGSWKKASNLLNCARCVKAVFLPDRLMVGPLPLEQSILVRIQVRQPRKTFAEQRSRGRPRKGICHGRCEAAFTWATRRSRRRVFRGPVCTKFTYSKIKMTKVGTSDKPMTSNVELNSTILVMVAEQRRLRMVHGNSSMPKRMWTSATHSAAKSFSKVVLAEYFWKSSCNIIFHRNKLILASSVFRCRRCLNGVGHRFPAHFSMLFLFRARGIFERGMGGHGARSSWLHNTISHILGLWKRVYISPRSHRR